MNAMKAAVCAVVVAVAACGPVESKTCPDGTLAASDGACVSPGCGAGQHDGGGGDCVKEGQCSQGHHLDGLGACVQSGCAASFHDGGDGACVAANQCSAGYHDDGSHLCVKSGCASGWHDGGDGTCVPAGACASTFDDGGDGQCVHAGTCSSGFHGGGDGKCVAVGLCASSYHDGGDGICVALGACATGFHDSGAGQCGPQGTCAAGFHDGGGGACLVQGTCANNFHDGGAGACVMMGTCSSGFHEGGEGTCQLLGTCSPTFHDDGQGTCASPGNCAVGFHDDGTGQACLVSGCAPGYHDGGDGACIATGTCALHFHDGGQGACFPEGTCAPSFHGDGTGKCVPVGQCASGWHDDGGGTCTADDNPVPCAAGYTFTGGSCLAGCVPGFHQDGLGTCRADSAVPPCAAGYLYSAGACVTSCVIGQHDDGAGTCVLAGLCAAGFHDDGSGSCRADAASPFCAAGWFLSGNACVSPCPLGTHDGGDGVCRALGTCVAGMHNDGSGACVASGCAPGYSSDGVSCVSTIGLGGCAPGFAAFLGSCFAPTCQPSEHNDGTGKCATTGCAQGYHLDGSSTACLPDLAAVVAGGAHACVLTSAGSVLCWGRNDSGQLGNGTTTDSAVPVQVAGLTSGVQALALGAKHSCALLWDDHVSCWGANDLGQLGDGTFVSRSVPARATGLGGSTIVGISAGEAHACALTYSSGVMCWGGNTQGALGGGASGPSAVPVYVSGLPNGSSLLSVVSGAHHSCAVTNAHETWCWGANADGELADATLFARSTPNMALSGTWAVYSGSSALHSLAVTTNGAQPFSSWGRNDMAQLGRGSGSLAESSPGPVSVLASNTTVKRFTAGAAHTCVLVLASPGYAARCWGSDADGRLGDAPYSPSVQPGSVATPQQVTGLTDGVLDISAGPDFTCAVTSMGSKVACWGNGVNGQTGDGSCAIAGEPVTVSGL